MSCSCTCKICNRKFDRYSGYLLNISDSLRHELSSNEKVKELSESGKHFVLCSACIESLLLREIKLEDLKFSEKRDGRCWYTSNLLFLYKKAIDKGDKILTPNGLVNMGIDKFKLYVALLKSRENKGILNLKKFDVFSQSLGKLYDLQFKRYLL